MEKDEQEIRKLVETWMAATKAGDVEAVLGLMTDDVVFLVPGRPPMRKSEFAAASKMQSQEAAPRIDGSSEIQEIKVLGDWAFMWARLRVSMTPAGGPERACRTHPVGAQEAGREMAARAGREHACARAIIN